MDDIAKLDDETEREIKWSQYYYEKWHELPNQQQQSALDRFWEQKDAKTLKELIGKEDGYKKFVVAGGTLAANKAMIDGLNNLVAQEIITASYAPPVAQEIAKTAYGEVAKIGLLKDESIVEIYASCTAAEKPTTTFACDASEAMTEVKDIAPLPMCITAIAGELMGNVIASQAGVTNPDVKNAFGAGGAMAGGSVAGAVVGRPIVGAAVGAGSWAVGQGIKALMNIGKGPDDNRCAIIIGDIGNDELCVGTYAGNDTMFWKTYWNEYKKSNSEFEMSAGQSQTGVFQLCIWHNDRVIKHFSEVYYRDMFVIVKTGRRFRVAHCKGQHHPFGSGNVSMFVI